MNGARWRLAAVVVAAALAGALVAVLVFRSRAAPQADEAKAEPKSVTIEAGEPTVEVDEKTQATIGLKTAAVASSQQSQQVQLFGTVVDVQELAAMQNQLANARAQLQQSSAKASADRAELARLRALNADNRAASDRAVQDAVATLAGDEANAASANASLDAARATATQRFGAAIASAMTSQSALYRDLLTFRTVLVQMTLPPGTPAPSSVVLTTNDGASINARLLSSAPRVDPRLQGASYFYLAPGGRLAPGMNVVAHYNGISSVTGVAIPADAIVSWQGKTWVYVRRDATHFSRREVAGQFTTNIAAGTQVVITGAQLLLSQEMRSQLGEE